MSQKRKCVAIVLAAGQGKRMEATVQKQYLELDGKPLIAHALSAFEQSYIIDDVILVASEGQTVYVQEEIVVPYKLKKVRAVTEGGPERYHSVWNGLGAIKDYYGHSVWQETFVFIHDGARPFVDEVILERLYRDVLLNGTSVAGMPSKDTIKIVDEEKYATHTPKRKNVWTVQTPQVFEAELIVEAYARMMETTREEEREPTDDAMVVEQYMKVPVKMTEASYRNIKITTPEDMEIAVAFSKCRKT